MSASVISDRARSDLCDIWAHIADASEAAADRVIAELVETFQLLGTHPKAGRLRPDIAAALRSFPAGEYVIFYTEQRSSVEIARVLHGRRNIARIFRS